MVDEYSSHALILVTVKMKTADHQLWSMVRCMLGMNSV